METKSFEMTGKMEAQRERMRGFRILSEFRGQGKPWARRRPTPAFGVQRGLELRSGSGLVSLLRRDS